MCRQVTEEFPKLLARFVGPFVPYTLQELWKWKNTFSDDVKLQYWKNRNHLIS